MFKYVYKNLDFSHKYTFPSSMFGGEGKHEVFEKHSHPCCEILIFVAGDVFYTAGQKTTKLHPGDIICIAPGVEHFSMVNEEVAYERYVLKFPAEILPEFARKLSPDGYWFNGNGKRYMTMFSNFDQYVKKFNDEELYTLFGCDLVKLITFLHHDYFSARETDDPLVTQLGDYIDTHISDYISLQTLADAFHCSKSSIAKRFKQYTNMPVMQYIRKKKAIAAHGMIMSGTPKTIAAEKTGFENYSTFYRCYIKMLKEEGLPPVKSRKKSREKEDGEADA